MLRWQYSQRPHLVMAGTSTRSPTANPFTASPTSVTVPTASWPRMRPSVTAATSPWRICRSVPQIVVVSTLTTTSVGSLMAASGTSSQAFRPGPWYTRAFMGPTLVIPVTPGCPKMGLSAHLGIYSQPAGGLGVRDLGVRVALGQVGQRDRDRPAAALGEDGLARGEVGDEGAQGGQPAAVRPGVGADAVRRRPGEDVQEPGRAGVPRGNGEGVQRLAARRARPLGLGLGPGNVAAVVGVPQQRARPGFDEGVAARRGLDAHHAARPVPDGVGEAARRRPRAEVVDDLTDRPGGALQPAAHEVAARAGAGRGDREVVDGP